jgi:hypothetical protein
VGGRPRTAIRDRSRFVPLCGIKIPDHFGSNDLFFPKQHRSV